MKQLASFAQKALNDPRLTYQAWTDTTTVSRRGAVAPAVSSRNQHLLAPLFGEILFEAVYVIDARTNLLKRRGIVCIRPPACKQVSRYEA
jgi:hypothetical protein